MCVRSHDFSRVGSPSETFLYRNATASTLIPLSSQSGIEREGSPRHYPLQRRAPRDRVLPRLRDHIRVFFCRNWKSPKPNSPGTNIFSSVAVLKMMTGMPLGTTARISSQRLAGNALSPVTQKLPKPRRWVDLESSKPSRRNLRRSENSSPLIWRFPSAAICGSICYSTGVLGPRAYRQLR